MSYRVSLGPAICDSPAGLDHATGQTTVRGKQAFELFNSASFCAAWDELFRRCPWSTVFQDRRFITTWYETYFAQFEPLVIINVSAGTLDGLLPLTLKRDGSQIDYAGTHHAEYQNWLALPDTSDRFIVEAITVLRKLQPSQPLRFKYLVGGVPLQWAKSAPWPCSIDSAPRPMLDTTRASEENFVKQKLRHRSTKNYLNRMERSGDLVFQRITDPAQIEAVTDEIFTNYDIRQGAAHGDIPFLQDSFKRQFHVRLAYRGGLVHLTTLSLKGEIVAAHFGLQDSKTLYLCIPSFSPFHGKSRAFTIHLLMLIELVIQEGLSFIDMTPGGDYKYQFANSSEEARVLTIHPTRTRAWLKKNSCFLRESAKARLPFAARFLKHGMNLFNRTRRAGITQLPTIMGRKLTTALSALNFRKELRVYQMPVSELHDSVSDPMAVDSLKDLLLYTGDSWQTRSVFLAEALKRLETGTQHVFTRVEDEKLVHFGWLLERQEEAVYSEINQSLKLPPGSAVLYDYYSHPCARGRGYYQESIRQMASAAARIPGTNQVVIACMANNAPSRHVIEKLGFRLFCSVTVRRRFGKTKVSKEYPAEPGLV